MFGQNTTKIIAPRKKKNRGIWFNFYEAVRELSSPRNPSAQEVLQDDNINC